MSWSEKYKRSIKCDNPKGFSQKAHCAARKKRQRGEMTKSESPFSESKESKEGQTFTKFTHKTKHLSKSQHQLDPNLDLKQLVHHAVKQYVDRDADGDIDVYDNPKKKTPDESPESAPVGAEVASRQLIAKQKGEVKHTRRGMAYEETMNEEGLRDWYGKSKSNSKKPGWVDVVDGDACAREKGETATPKCVPSWKRNSMSKAERLAAQARKRRQDPNQPQKSGAEKPTYVKTDYTLEGDMDLQEVKDKPGKGSGKKDACYHKVKSRYSVWPSAYASGALVKCRKVGADNWGNKTEETTYNSLPDWEAPIYNNEKRYCPKCQKMEISSECKYGPKFWALYSSAIEPSNQQKFDIAQVHPANEEKDHEYSMARSELSTIISAAKRLKKKMKGEGSIEAWVQSKITKAADYIDTAADYIDSGEHKIDETVVIQDASGKDTIEFIDIIKPEPLKPSQGIGSQLIDEAGKKCWPGYKKAGTQKLFGKTYNRCVKESFSNWREELGISELLEDWQKVNRKDKTDGLSQAAVNAYRRENPGSKLQTAVTEKKPKGKRAKRRASFCRRMRGMKDKLTSAETARDPDSRINRALRRWNCN
jgi:hypothetical protein